jgi:hypothetical protein
MVSVMHNGIQRNAYVGLSSEGKPSDAPDGSTFLEADTDTYWISYQGGWTQYTPFTKKEEGR